MTYKKSLGGGTSSVRDSNIELFRIITMLLIVSHHFVVNSGLTLAEGPLYASPLSWRSLFLLVFGAWGKTGINCFVLITGYFMCKSHITWRKFAKLFFELMFYRIVISSIFWLSGYEQFTLIELIKVLIPVRNIGVGFASAFLVFYLLIPFLNVAFQNMKERQHLMLIAWCSFTYVFLGTLPGFSVTMNYVSWFSVLYIIASYIRLYPKKIYQNTCFWGCMTIVCMLISIISVIASAWLGTKIGCNMAYYFVTDSNTFLAVVTGICSFMFFKNLKIGYNRFINIVAASTFGVLCIHANSDTMRRWLWRDIVDVVGHYSYSFMPIYAIGSVLVIFVVCAVIDLFRIHFVEKPFFKLLDKYWDGGIYAKYKRLETKLFSKLGVGV